MFTEYLKEHPLRESLRFPCAPVYPEAGEREKWARIPEDFREELLRLGKEWKEIPYPLLKATQFMAFSRNGSRAAWEKPYFDRRRKLAAMTLAYCLTGEADYLDEIADGVWCICEETSWVISAHNGSDHPGTAPMSERILPDFRNPYIDLFAAQTAMILTYVLQLTGKALDGISPLIRRWAEESLERRILTPFETRDDFWWMGFIRKDLCNWTPWIVSNVMITATGAIREDRSRLCALLERACGMLDRYLDVIPEDGGCDEGVGYWNMAGGALLDCLELLERVTDGKVNFRDNSKIRNMMDFPRKATIGRGWCVNFADCDARPELNGERLRKAGEMLEIPELVRFGAQYRMGPEKHLSDTPQLARLLCALFHDAPQTTETERTGDEWLPDLQLRVVRAGRTTLVCKGGHNGESHNHNDVGSFMLYVDGEPAVVDAGNMTYTAKTFSARRYELWNIRSAYHNVPMIGGLEQLPGADRKARNTAYLADGLRLDMAGCYPDGAETETCARELTLDPDGRARILDRIVTRAPKTVEWVFMLREKPILAGNRIRSGSLTLTAPEGPEIKAEEIPVTDARMARSFPGSLWRLTVTAEAATEHVAEFRFVAE